MGLIMTKRERIVGANKTYSFPQQSLIPIAINPPVVKTIPLKTYRDKDKDRNVCIEGL